MYRTSFQRGLLTVLFSGGSDPLKIWEITKSRDGYIERFLDQDIKAMVIQIGGNNVSTTYLSCPRGKQVLGICMPFLVMIVKNLNKYFVFEITILDETGTRRRFRVANFQSTTQISPLCTVMPLCLSEGWNQIQFNLAEFTRRAYNKQFVEVQKIKINANIRIRRIYCAEKLMTQEELPPEYKIFFPILSQQKGKAKQRQASVVKSDNDSGVMQVSLAAATAPAEGVDAKGGPATPVDAEGEAHAEVRAGSTAGETALDKDEPVEATLVEGKPGEEIPAGEIEEGETALADETPAVKAAEVQSLPEGEEPEVEELAGEVTPAEPDAEPSEPALPEPTNPAEPEDEERIIDEANSTVE